MRRFQYSIVIALAAVMLAALSAFVMVMMSPERKRTAEYMTVSCLDVDRGPRLKLSQGLIFSDGKPVGKYSYLPAVPGKYGPTIEVSGIEISAINGNIQIEPGQEEWFWRFLNEDTVEVTYYPANTVLAHRCAEPKLR